MKNKKTIVWKMVNGSTLTFLPRNNKVRSMSEYKFIGIEDVNDELNCITYTKIEEDDV